MTLYDSFQVIVPAFNEESRIDSTLRHLTCHCRNVTVFDNCSTDNTALIVRSKFHNVKLVTLKNEGTSETYEWWIAASRHFTSDYILFAGCSEFVPERLLHLFSQIALSTAVDIVDTPRLSITGTQSTDYLYCRPSSLFSPAIKLPRVARFVRWRSIDASTISPHDTFRSQKHCVRFTLDTADPGLCIHHYRLPPSRKTFNKHLNYARLYAASRCRSNPIYALLDSSARCVLDTSRVLRALFDRKASRLLLQEYILRVLMHIQVFWFSVLLSLRIAKV
jgi:glycosyltransferase involved in cell wall biosynthesis